MTLRLLPAVIAVALFAAGCTSDGEAQPSPAPTGTTGDASTFAAQVASSDLAADSAEPVQVGVFSSTDEAGVQLLSFGEIAVEFSYLGADGGQTPQAGPSTTAGFVAAPGDEADADVDGPTLTNPADVAGVYITPELTFPDAGIWNATITASVDDGDPLTLESAFNVYPEHRIPAPGDEALATESLTIDSKAPAVAIDSRAHDGAEVPDPELHDATIAETIRGGTPLLLQFATPVYCTSNFCGPTVEAQEELAQEYGDVAEFIHVEIWRNFDDSIVNEAAADWLLRDGDLTEPWLYLIDGDGMIVDRWGPLFDLDDVRASLDALGA